MSKAKPLNTGDKIKESLVFKDLPLTQKQKEFLDLSTHKDIKVLICTGPAGSSKTFISVLAALKLLNEKKISDIYYIRAAVESADSKIGYLPGTLEDKISNYSLPCFDKLYEILPKSQADALIKQGKVKPFAINYSRGMSWDCKALIIDEAQSMTSKEIVTMLTRIGKFTKAFVLADPMQSDLKANGAAPAITKVKELLDTDEARRNGIYTFEFTEDDIMRSELVKFLVKEFKKL